MNRPNFFIVGAPKCGTTAMNEFLDAHPQVFMGEKELHYFGSDLAIHDRIGVEAYLGKFSGAGSVPVIGEASVWYLASKNAAREIHHFNPAARILIMVRNPVEMIPSLHNQHLLDGNEQEGDLEQVLDREWRRKVRAVGGKDFETLPSYEDAVSFSENIQRYWDVFGKEKVHVILHDDFRANPEATYQNLLHFLQVDPHFMPEWKGVNERREIRALPLHRMIKQPPGAAKRIARMLIPVKSWRHCIMSGLTGWNVRAGKPASLSPATRDRLKEVAAPEINRLETLLGRNLKHWLAH